MQNVPIGFILVDEYLKYKKTFYRFLLLDIDNLY